MFNLFDVLQIIGLYNCTFYIPLTASNTCFQQKCKPQRSTLYLCNFSNAIMQGSAIFKVSFLALASPSPKNFSFLMLIYLFVFFYFGLWYMNIPSTRVYHETT
ncbi:hypothetical protein EV426DRAFT_254920 [Tirmania nivea]|nr:hypothetical protein EV426DRAFT_254920 [Tirmania nivea]